MNINKFFYTTFLISSTLFVSCNNEDFVQEDYHQEQSSIKVSLEESTIQSRAGFIIPEGHFFWNTDDVIGVAVNNVANNELYFRNFNLTSGAGTNSAKFNGILTNGDKFDKYAVYPFDKAHQLTETTLTYHLPTDYVYHHVDQTMPSATDNLVNFNSMRPAMAGIIENNKTHLKHLCGMILVKLDDMPYASGTITISTLDYYHKLAGDFTIDLAMIGKLGSDFGGIALEETSTDAECNVNIKYENAEVGKPGHFYIPAPVGTYYGFKLSFIPDDSTQPTLKLELLDEFAVERTKIKVFTVESVSGGN